MAAKTYIGFELNSTANNVETTGVTGLTIQSSVAHSGTYAAQATSLVSGTAKFANFQFAATGTTAAHYIRVAFRVDTLPSAENRIFAVTNSTTNNTNVRVSITIDNTGVLRLYDDVGQIGSASSPLSTSQWYLIDIYYDLSGAAGSDIVRARVGASGTTPTEFAGASNRTVTGGVGLIYFGGNLAVEAQTTGNWYFDSIQINDGTGSFENSYPAQEYLGIVRPNAAGDVNTFATQTGGTAGAANNYTRVNEVTPDSATSFNGSNTLNQEDMFECDNTGRGASDTIGAVLVGFNYRNNTADATTAITIQAKKVSGGTVAQSASITRNATAFVSNSNAAPRNYPLVMHQNPDNVNWTQSTLDTMQIGYKLTTAGTNRIDVTAIWAYYSYTPVAAPPSVSGSATLLTMGVG